MSAFKRGDRVELTKRGRRIVGNRSASRWKPVYTGTITTARRSSYTINVRRSGHRASESWWRGFWKRRPPVTPQKSEEER